MTRVSRQQVAWGLLGALTAATFAVWMFAFPDTIADGFAWEVKPRYAQLFIGAGYVFRTLFFLNVAREPNWLRLRWIIVGNLVFTGTLLLATYWHAEDFNWNPFQTPAGHLWLVLYIFEPLTMLYIIPKGIRSVAAPLAGGPIHMATKYLLILVAGVLLMDGLLLVINPEFAATRWPWELNPLDARIIAAWFLGWAAWSAAMAFATDWDEIRTGVLLFIVNGVALLATAIASRSEFLPRGTANGYVFGLGILIAIGFVVFVLQERNRPAERPWQS
jgi:hypothetical protein